MQPHLERVAAATPGADCARWRRMLSELVSRFAENLLLGALSDDAPGFIFREQNHPTEAFEALYEKLFRPMPRPWWHWWPAPAAFPARRRKPS